MKPGPQSTPIRCEVCQEPIWTAIQSYDQYVEGWAPVRNRGFNAVRENGRKVYKRYAHDTCVTSPSARDQLGFAA